MAVERQAPTVDRGSAGASASLQASVASEIRDRLEPGEKLLWSGRPRQGPMLRSSDFLVIPFSLLWCGFAVFWEAMAFAQGAPPFVMLWGGMFVLFGLYFVFGRFIADAMSRARSYYAVTDRRVIIVGGLLRKNVRSLFLRNLAEAHLFGGRAGRGTIYFGPMGLQMTVMRGFPGADRRLPPAFDGIERAEQVLKIIQKAQEAAR